MNSHRLCQQGLTVIEILVSITVITLLLVLLLPAIQFARSASRRVACSNKLRQIGMALHVSHDSNKCFPAGVIGIGADSRRNMTWLTQTLPYLEYGDVLSASFAAYDDDPSPYSARHADLMALPLQVVLCPEDSRGLQYQITRNNRRVALTSYLGSSGTDCLMENGILYKDSAVSLAQISDGSSQTLLVGERPASADFYYGWWYAGYGQVGTGSLNSVLGVCELNMYSDPQSICGAGPFTFRRGSETDNCDRFHFWSLHSGGGNFLFADGSIRFFSYAGAPNLPAHATRSGNEIMSQ